MTRDFGTSGDRVVAVIAERLLARINQLIATDPEACACKEMLTTLGVRYRAAQAAVEALRARTGL